jgi:hypothetical protein
LASAGSHPLPPQSGDLPTTLQIDKRAPRVEHGLTSEPRPPAADFADEYFAGTMDKLGKLTLR